MTTKQNNPLTKIWDCNLFNIKNATNDVLKRDPRILYIAFDIHNTICDTDQQFYFYAVETLQFISQCPNMKLIMWSYYQQNILDDWNLYLKNNKVSVDYINQNPDFKSPRVFYDILLDSRAGFNGQSHWRQILQALTYSNTLIENNVKVI